ncbi:MAG TPA: beta-L-arabinofuranosidase domain-containing protein [Bryobacteraceae bacterium]|nr:beta-L-arabinofuranosidase domain-containing protein [Bryobacteraceae bacterium]
MRSIQRISVLASLALAWSAAQTPPGAAEVHAVRTPTAAGANPYYTGNRPPLAPNPLIKLPLGSVRPEGWLRRQLVLESQGFSGKLEEISQFCKFQGNEWTSPAGEGKFGWEEVPYWLRGYVDLGYILQDPAIIQRANQWLNAVIATQRPDGYFGSQSNLEGERINGRRTRMLDLWPNMTMMFALRSLYEATGDPRVLPFLTKYFRWQTTVPLEDFLPGSWQKQRAGDNLDSIYWLYNRTGDPWLLNLALVNHERTDDWSGGIASWHNVNFAECFREPAQFFQQIKDARYLNATVRNYDTMHRLYGQVPGGGYAADENARPGFNGPRNGTETCAWAELMFSDEILVGITGDRTWADRAEEVAFNSFPASMTPDLKGLHYITSPNQIQLDRANKSPLIQNTGEMFAYDPYTYRCCQHNAAFGWPYFAEHLWMATRDNGLAAVLYAPSKVTAKAGDGTPVTLTETTAYPFDDAIAIAVDAPKTVRFPLVLRVPAWCANPEVRLNGKPLAESGAGGWLVLDRAWSAGDKVVLTLPMKIAVKVWKENRNTVSVSRGPLTYSLKIGERWVRDGGTDEFPAEDVYPTTPWNYGLVLNVRQPAESFTVVRTGKTAPQPFAENDVPIELRAEGRRIPQWKQEPNGMIGEVEPGPVKSDQPVEQLTLIPMGAARLRISSFPQIGTGPDAQSWDFPAPIVQASASTHFEPPSAVFDGLVGANSADRSIPRFVWPRAGGRGEGMWIEYRYSAARPMSSAEVYWAADAAGNGCALPASWSLEWWDNGTWKPVEGVTAYPAEPDRFNRVRFKPVTTTAVRLRAAPMGGQPVGILEWRIGE